MMLQSEKEKRKKKYLLILLEISSSKCHAYTSQQKIFIIYILKIEESKVTKNIWNNNLLNSTSIFGDFEAKSVQFKFEFK